MNPTTASLIGSGIQTGSNIGASVLNYISAQQQRKWSEDMMNQQNAWDLEQWNRQNEWDLNMWNKTNAYNSPSAQVDRMKAAGLNPLYYGLDGSSAQSFQAQALESASPTPYERASFHGVGNPLEGYADAKVKEAQIRNIDADTVLKKEQTDEQTLINEFLNKTMDFRVEGEKLKNDVSKKQLEIADKEIEKIGEEIKEIIARTESEAAKKLLYEADANLKNVEAWRVIEMLPYEKALAEAKTEHEKAAASAAWAQAAYQNEMISSGYIDTMISEMKSRIDKNNAEVSVAEQEAGLKELENTIRHGNANDLSKWFNEHPWAKAAMPSIAFLSGDCFRVASEVEQSCGKILGPVLGLAAGGKMLGSQAAAAGHTAGRGLGTSVRR